MLSQRARIAVLTTKAAIKYGPAIEDNAALLRNLIELVRVVDYVPKRTAWPRRMLAYLYEQQRGVCAACHVALPSLDLQAPHVDHVVPWSQGGDNGGDNIRLLHATCNLEKGDACSPDDVIRHLEYRLLNLRARPVPARAKD
jgi:CRISPR/Cas system Type II protein with McrA/HNH and RuvC-like nuclease domain